ncbi:TonB-dependent receptor plug [Emticicia oligotrophica DSM 17448]|uniref:TonB-dependent receptor plug n=1 Tax=Emticicia oligotrophica (strain DSM 17448 / CIP 109782 / MTCC 6937 / GPTSA100-15) TaxID=929562 RepID=A0ABM5N2J6_EMTOG|nr:SusC/RagA family TonB-linked outer membrane protein [Emticicia oligotrophica]AFK03682.1 TonB-dependent receptor plug [Emticicia oligotrophica DSM 17448]
MTNKITKNIILVLSGLILSLSAMAQQNRKITGKIIDSENRMAIVGASISAINGKNVVGTVTNENGEFTLNIDSKTQQIKVSSVGYKTQEVALGGQSELTIRLESGEVLGEVVVTALGLERQSRNLGYAVQQIDAKEVSKVKSTNFLDNLAGKIAGVNITAGSTGVGSTTRISIRGESSFTNTNPLFVVDGIPINNNTIVNNVNDDANGFMEVDFGNGAMEVNPDDIESVTVLKGPSAAALYGTRASNGVIIIKTKTGAKSRGIGISFNSSNYAETPFQLPVFQNTFGLGNSGQYAYKDGLGGGINDNITYSYGPKLDAGLSLPQYDSPVTLVNGQVVRAGDVAIHGGLPITPTPFVAYPNNLKDFYQTGHTTINNLAFTAGNEKGNFRLSMTDLNSKSYIPGVDLKRRTVSTAFNFSPISKLKITSNINYVNAGSSNRPATKYGSENINYAMVAWFGRSNNIEPLKNYWQPGLENVQQFSYNYTYFDNPYFTLYENRNAFNRDRVFGNLSARYEFTPELSLQVRTGMDYQNEDRTFRRAFSSNRFKTGAYAEQNVFYREINSDFMLNYTKKLGVLSVDISAGGNRMDQRAVNEQVQALSLAQPGVYALSNAASPLEYYQAVGNKRINSLYGLAKFSFKDFLFVDITGRNDWSSALATATSSANTSFFYPSVSAGLVVSNFVKLPMAISFLKLRASYAQVGNDTSPFQTIGTFVARTPVGGLPTFSDQSQISNANLKPESISSTELGADIRFLNDKIKLDVTYFNALNKNQIISLPIALSSGYVQQSVNGGAVRSKGLEVVLDLLPIRTQEFSWRSTFNFSTYKNIVEKLPIPGQTITLAYNRIYDSVNQTVWYQVQVGGRMGDMYGTGYLKNEKGEFIIGKDGRYIVNNNLIKLGNYNPDFMLGFNNSLSYKNFQLGFLFDWRQGGKLVSRTLALAAVAGQLIETENRPTAGIIAKGVVNVGTIENPNYQPNTVALNAETYYRMYYDRNHEENNTYNASYLKLREVLIGYELPKSWLKNKIESLNVSLIGRNLYAFSHIPHFDPEQFGFQGQKLMSGVEDMSYPTTRSFGIKLGITF